MTKQPPQNLDPVRAGTFPAERRSASARPVKPIVPGPNSVDSAQGSTVPGDEALTAAAVRAFRQTHFYEELYGNEPRNASMIPFISEADYHRASGLLDCLVDRLAIVGILPPYERDASRFPWPAAEDEAELILRQARIVRAMRHLGVDFGARPRLLIVTDRHRGPFACELAKGFYWEGFQTSISFDAHTKAESLNTQVERHDPDYVVLISGRRFRDDLDRPRHTVWVVERCGDGPVGMGSSPALLYADGIDLVGSRAAGASHYDCDAEQLHLEVNPGTGLSHVSKLHFSCFPLVRYSLGQHVPTIDPRHQESR